MQVGHVVDYLTRQKVVMLMTGYNYTNIGHIVTTYYIHYVRSSTSIKVAAPQVRYPGSSCQHTLLDAGTQPWNRNTVLRCVHQY